MSNTKSTPYRDPTKEPLRQLRRRFIEGPSEAWSNREEFRRRWLSRDANDLFKDRFNWLGRSDAVRVVPHNKGWSIVLMLDGVYSSRGDAEGIAEMMREDVLIALQNAERTPSPFKGTPHPIVKRRSVAETMLSAFVPEGVGLNKVSLRKAVPDVDEATVQRWIDSLIADGLLRSEGLFYYRTEATA